MAHEGRKGKIMYKNDKLMYKKYADVLDVVNKAMDTDGDGDTFAGPGNALVLCYMQAAVRSGTIENIPGVPEDFDWEQFKKDMEHCEMPEEEPVVEE